jgi:hypothetical protein
MALIQIGTAGCGQYIEYDESYQPPGGAALGDFPVVAVLDHYVLSALLGRFVSTSTDQVFALVDYDAFSADLEASYLLGQYLATLAAVEPSKLNADQRLPYWINGYNASVVAGVLAVYKGSAQFKVTDSGTFFDDAVYLFAGSVLSLNQIEHGIIRGKFEHASVTSAVPETKTKIQTWHEELWGTTTLDARIHAALNCGARSCPNLLWEAPFVYRAETLETQLATATRRWLDSEEKGAGKNGVSKLFEWYGEDFVAAAGSIGAFIAKHRTGGLADVAASKFLDYDWTLNIK